MIRRDGTVLADGWLPDFVRLGELERHLGDGVEVIVDAALKERREKTAAATDHVVPLVIRLSRDGLMPDASYCESLARLAGVLADVPFAWNGTCHGEGGHGMAAAGPGGPAGVPVLAGGRAAHRR